MKSPEQDEEYFTKSVLIARGWTEKSIREIAGEPHKTSVNPHYRTAPRVQLWDAGFIAKAEASDAFKELWAKSEKRRLGAIKAQETRLAKPERFTKAVLLCVEGREKEAEPQMINIIESICDDIRAGATTREVQERLACGEWEPPRKQIALLRKLISSKS